MRLLTRALAALALLLGGAALAAMAQAATPQLYLYEGNSCAVTIQNAAARNMLGRKEDGDVVFVSDNGGAADLAYGNVDYGLGCYKSQVANVALSVPLQFDKASAGAYGLTKGAYTLEDVAAGRLDAFFAHVAYSAVVHGFPAAQMRLGWEMNGNWYTWKASGRAATFQAAFCRAEADMKAAEPTARFTYWVNPSTNADASGEIPPCADGVAWDQYENIYTTVGAKAEPQRWTNALSGWWGIASMASFHGSARHAAPEAGAGALGDDPLWLGNLIAYDVAQRVEWFGLWDSNASYAGRISDGSKPGEALELLKEWSAAPLPTLLAGAELYEGTAYKVSAPAGYHAFLAQLADGHVEQFAWGDAVGQTLQATDLTAQAAAAVTVAQALTVTNSQGATAKVVPNADGSAVIEVTFPSTAAHVTYDLKLSSPRKLGFAATTGGLLGGLWQGGKLFADFTWGTAGGTARVYVPAA